MSEGFMRPKDEIDLAPLGPPIDSSTQIPATNTRRQKTLRRSVGIIMGIGSLWIMAGQLPHAYHVTCMDHHSPVVAQVWRFIAPTAAVDQWQSHAKCNELERWIKEEQVIAWAKISSNIGPAAGASDGIIIASPSAGQRLTEPDYYVSALFLLG
jgi:hypothetical protein